MKAAGSFDDIVISLDGKLPVMMQLKHRCGNVQTVYENQLVQLKGSFTLLKYCKTYRDLQNGWNKELDCCGTFSNCVFVLYTNANISTCNSPLKQKNIEKWQDIINSGGYYFKVSEIFPNIQDTFQNLPKYRDVLKSKCGNESQELLVVVNKLWDKSLRKLPSGEKELQKLKSSILKELETLGDLSCYEHFLPRVWVFARQCSEGHMDYLIQQEIQTLCGTNDITVSKRVFVELAENVKSWWQNGKYFLEEYNHIWQGIVRDLEAHLSEDVCKKFADLDVYFEPAATNRVRKIMENKQFLHIIARNSVLLTCVKIKQCLEGLNHIIIGIKVLETRISEVLALLRWCDAVVIVVEELNNTNMVISLTDKTLERSGDCKVILISTETYKYNETFTDDCNLSHLDVDCRARVLKSSVFLQGELIQLKDVLDDIDQMESVICGDTIIQFLSGVNISLGSSPEELIDYFIYRSLERRDIINKDVLEEQGSFAISNMSSQILSHMKKEKNAFKAKQTSQMPRRIYEIADEHDFEQLCTTTPNIHWLRVEGDSLHWVRSKGDIKIIQRHAIKVSYFKDIMDISERLVLLLAEPGMGKSTLMTFLAREIKRRQPSFWVIHVKLNDYSEYLEESSAISLLERVANLKTNFEKSLFFYNIKITGNVIVLLDGFDEISPDYGEKAINILQNLIEDTKVKQIWITSRPNMKKILEEQFSSLAYKLTPFNKEDQKSFLHKFWNCDYINDFVDNLLELTNQWLNDRLGQFTGIPLQTLMLAEAFLEDMLHYTKTKEVRLPEKMDLMQLYDRFVETKLNIYFRDKIKAGVHNVGMNAVLKVLKKGIYEEHMVCAVIGFFPVSLRSLIPNFLKLKSAVDTFLEKVCNGSEKTGIIVGVTRRKPAFVHKTFEEYFTALWLVDNYSSVRKLIELVIFSPDYYVVRDFFNRALVRNSVLHTALLNYDTDSVEKLLKESPELRNSIDAGSRSPLHIAVLNYLDMGKDKSLKKKGRNIIHIIVHSGAEPNILDSVLLWTPIQYANKMKAWEAMDVLIEAGADICVLNISKSDVNNKVFSYTVMPLLIRKGYLNVMKFHLNIIPEAATFTFPANYDLQTGWLTPLHEAAKWGHIDLVQLLLDGGADIEFVDTLWEETPLLWAARNNQWQMVQFLLDKGTNVNIQSKKDGVSILHLAVQSGDERLVELLLMRHRLLEQIDLTAKDGTTPLICAAKSKKWNVVKLLIERGANKLCILPNGITLLHLTVKTEEEEILALILEDEAVRQGINVKARGHQGDTVLTTAARSGHWRTVQQLLKYGANSPNTAHLIATFGKDSSVRSLLNIPEVLNGINELNDAGLTPLMQAAKIKNWEMFKIILEYGGNVSPTSRTSVLHLAILSHDASLVKFVLNTNSVASDITNIGQEAAIQDALRFGLLEISQSLITHHPTLLHTRAADGSTVLHLAAESGNVHLLQYLLLDMNLLDSIDSEDNKGETPLFRAVLKCKFLTVVELHKHGADITKCNARGETLMHAAVRSGYLKVADWLVQRNADLMQPDNAGITPLHIAANCGKLSIVQWLVVNQRVAVNVCDNLQRTPIVLAVSGYHLPTTKFLIEHEAKLNYRSQEGKTLLHLAASDHRILAILLERTTVDIDVKDDSGKTPLHFAAQCGCLDSIELLTKEGANLAVRDDKGLTALDLAMTLLASFKKESRRQTIGKMVKFLQKKISKQKP